MAENSAIEWTDHTFNPWEGCQKVGPGCDHCYAETRNARFGGGVAGNWGPGAPRRRTSISNWRKPLRWQAEAAAFMAGHGRRQRVFCASLADVFDNAVEPSWRADLFELIRTAPDLDWLLLTKRPGNVAPMLHEIGLHTPPINVGIGASIVNQAEANRDIPKLLRIPATLLFLSLEPLLGPIDLRHLQVSPEDNGCWRVLDALTGARGHGCRFGFTTTNQTGPRVDWVIVGGESGPGARPMHPDWARSLRDQCLAVSTPFLFKQWGENAWAERVEGDPSTLTAYRAGKKAAGRQLDGIQHDGVPA